MNTVHHPLIGKPILVSNAGYTGIAIVLEYDAAAPKQLEVAGPFYCHLLGLCAHAGYDEGCDDSNDECVGEDCRGWYAIRAEGLS